MGRTISASIGLLFLFVFVVLFGLTGCEKTVTVTEIERDTLRDTLVRVDTLLKPKGPAYVRFISMLPDRVTATIGLYRGPAKTSAIFGAAGEQMRNEFIPVPELSALQLYGFFNVNGTEYLDSLTLPPFEPTEMHTCALFRLDDLSTGGYNLVARYSWDSMKVIPPGEGKCYLRLINGIADYPNPNHVNLKLKSVDSAALFAEPVQFTRIANYVEIPAGLQTVYITSPDESLPLYQQQYIFAQGGYYTAMVVGLKGQGTDKLIISAEN